MGFIDHLIELIKSPKVKLPWKVTVIIIIVLVGLLINNVLGFTYSYKLEKETSLIRDLDELAYGEKSDTETKQYALTRKYEILHRKNILEKFENVVTNIKWKKDKSKPTKHVTKANVSHIVLHLTSSVLFYILALLVFVVLLFERDEESFFIDFVISSVTGLVVGFIGYLIHLATSLIPIFDQPWINYILNSFLQIVIIGSLLWVAVKEDNKTKEKERMLRINNSLNDL